MNRKRSHDDLEDADECLPISKRINSLHLEGKAQGMYHGQHHLGIVQQLDGFTPEPDMLHPCMALEQGSAPHSNQDALSSTRRQHLHHHHELNEAASKYNNHQSYALPPVSDTALNISSGSNARVPPVHPHSYPHHHLPSHSFQNSSHAMLTNGVVVSHNSSTTPHFSTSDELHATRNTNCHPNHGEHENLNSFHHPAQMSSFAHQSNTWTSRHGIDLAGAQYNVIPCAGQLGIMNALTTVDEAHSHPQQHNDDQELPHGPYDPELGMTENPHYYDNNKLLYEAHVARLQRILPDYQ